MKTLNELVIEATEEARKKFGRCNLGTEEKEIEDRWFLNDVTTLNEIIAFLEQKLRSVAEAAIEVTMVKREDMIKKDTLSESLFLVVDGGAARVKEFLGK